MSDQGEFDTSELELLGASSQRSHSDESLGQASEKCTTEYNVNSSWNLNHDRSSFRPKILSSDIYVTPARCAAFFGSPHHIFLNPVFSVSRIFPLFFCVHWARMIFDY